MKNSYPFLVSKNFNVDRVDELNQEFINSKPFNHVVIDNFLPIEHANFFYDNFPKPNHPIWLDWKIRSKFHYGKQGIGNNENFDLLDPNYRFALNELNSSFFLTFLEKITGFERLLPDPYFSGGGLHQILEGGILDIHTDFNDYQKLQTYRQLNVLIYLTKNYEKDFGGELELWDKSPKNKGVCFKKIEPIFNRCVIFKTDKTSWHGHPNEWRGSGMNTRKSIAMYYYTSKPFAGFMYDGLTDFQDYVSKELPKHNSTSTENKFKFFKNILKKMK